MKILLTGTTSFTGMWFAKTLTEAGHEVIATLQKKKIDYKDLKLKRLEVLEKLPIRFVEECSFGDEKFISIIKEGIDSLNHHGANVENYKSLDFDVLKATADNTKNIRCVMQACKENGIQQIVLTGSVFEQDEGIGTEPLEAFSPYGLSKGLTYQIFRYWANQYKIKLKKFVIPNPFGPYEEPRFTAYLINCVKSNTEIVIGTPNYIRDNIYIEDLADAYIEFNKNKKNKANPSGIVSTQGDFAEFFLKNVSQIFNKKSMLVKKIDHEILEPEARTNTKCGTTVKNTAWKSIVAYYSESK